MGSYFLYALLCAVGPAVAQTSTLTADLLVFQTPTATPAPKIEAAVLGWNRWGSDSVGQTIYYINCPDDSLSRTKRPPCDLLDNASVTVNPSTMTFNIEQQTIDISVTEDITRSTSFLMYVRNQIPTYPYSFPSTNG
jgi:hypothetical protein